MTTLAFIAMSAIKFFVMLPEVPRTIHISALQYNWAEGAMVVVDLLLVTTVIDLWIVTRRGLEARNTELESANIGLAAAKRKSPAKTRNCSRRPRNWSGRARNAGRQRRTGASRAEAGGLAVALAIVEYRPSTRRDPVTDLPDAGIADRRPRGAARFWSEVEMR